MSSKSSDSNSSADPAPVGTPTPTAAKRTKATKGKKAAAAAAATPSKGDATTAAARGLEDTKVAKRGRLEGTKKSRQRHKDAREKAVFKDFFMRNSMHRYLSELRTPPEKLVLFSKTGKKLPTFARAVQGSAVRYLNYLVSEQLTTIVQYAAVLARQSRAKTVNEQHLLLAMHMLDRRTGA